MKFKRKTLDVQIKSAENGIIKGYAATWTREPDSYGDVIAKGAFEEDLKAIKEEGRTLPLLWNHDSYNLDAYIGTVTVLKEDDHGLYFEAAFDDTPEAQRARDLAISGRLTKFSFAYDILDQASIELEDGRDANELRKLRIHEVSLVMYPANPDTSVTEVKTGRRNSKKGADDLRAISELLGQIQSIINSLLADDEPEDDTEDKPEDQDTDNDEDQKRLKGLIEKANSILEKGQEK